MKENRLPSFKQLERRVIFLHYNNAEYTAEKNYSFYKKNKKKGKNFPLAEQVTGFNKALVDVLK